MNLSLVKKKVCFVWSMDEGSGTDKCVGRGHTPENWVSGRGIMMGGPKKMVRGLKGRLRLVSDGLDGVRGDGGDACVCARL